MSTGIISVPVCLTTYPTEQPNPALYKVVANLSGSQFDYVGASVTDPFVYYLFADGRLDYTLNITPAIEQLAREGTPLEN